MNNSRLTIKLSWKFNEGNSITKRYLIFSLSSIIYINLVIENMNVISGGVPESPLDHRQKINIKESRHCGILCIEKYRILLKCLLEGESNPYLKNRNLYVLSITPQGVNVLIKSLYYRSKISTI